MKRFTLFIALVLATISTAASARSVDMTPVVAKLDIFHYGLLNLRGAAVLDDGRFQVMDGTNIRTRMLSPAALQEIRFKALQLSFADVVTETREHICYTFAPVNTETLSIGNVDHTTNEFIPMGGTRVLLTHQGCQMREVARPSDEHFFRLAEELSAQLLILSLDTVLE